MCVCALMPGEGKVPHGDAAADNGKAESPLPQEEDHEGDHEELDEHTDPEEFDDLLS